MTSGSGINKDRGAASLGITTTTDAASGTATTAQRATTAAANEGAATKPVTLDGDAIDTRAATNKFVPKLTGELSSSDKEILEGMEKLGYPNLANAATMKTTYSKLTSASHLTEYGAAVDAARAATADPSASNVSRVADYVNNIAINTGANVMEILFFVFRESIQATNDDKKYFLEKLTDYNTMAERLSEYLSKLVDESQNLSQAAAGAKYPEKVTIPVTVEKFDVSVLKPWDPATMNKESDRVASAAGYPQTKTLDRAGLNDTIKDVEAMQETVRNKRQMASTAFQNFDQKANQLYNLMASVLKVMNEMRSGTTRNML